MAGSRNKRRGKGGGKKKREGRRRGKTEKGRGVSPSLRMCGVRSR